MLVRALAGRWPWGSGTVLLPPPEQLLFLPQRPYLPPGSLRQAVSYPAAAEAFPDAAVRAALERVGLGHLVGQLAEHRRWEIGRAPCRERVCQYGSISWVAAPLQTTSTTTSETLTTSS